MRSKRPKPFNHVLSLVIKTSEDWFKTDSGRRIFQEYKSYLEKEGGKEIRVEEDSELPTARVPSGSLSSSIRTRA